MARWLMLFLLLAPSARALDLGALQRLLDTEQPVRGHFQQSKTLAFLSKPMVSEGAYLMAPGLGLIWDQATPWPQEMILSQGKLTMDGETVEMQAGPFAPVIAALMQGQLETLREHFTLAGEGSLESWRLHLVPRAEPMIQLFSAIEIRGEQQRVLGLTLTDTAAQPTEIRFSDIHFGELKEDERARF
ncbi:outer membrane lipoprotein carrier protein LolA [Ferrimonas sp. YFM]|uniref:LolA family protein n=1 Tax=Ferrimonas sp. YFM TaxID=3028878 RepID=UPI0025744A37|nr:outer membrane lipoprotein carrier protein LolA [Ferrimonas sp. YFM]BDY04387.1 outer-membrane lipoprotein carrier protein [Ferrimonas sp. YFM]